MKKLMVVVAAFAFAAAVYAQDAKPAAVAAPAVKAEAVVCAECAKLNKDIKAGEAAKVCAACQKKADEAKLKTK